MCMLCACVSEYILKFNLMCLSLITLFTFENGFLATSFVFFFLFNYKIDYDRNGETETRRNGIVIVNLKTFDEVQ